jgi:hypothetical protein
MPAFSYIFCSMVFLPKLRYFQQLANEAQDHNTAGINSIMATTEGFFGCGPFIGGVIFILVVLMETFLTGWQRFRHWLVLGGAAIINLYAFCLIMLIAIVFGNAGPIAGAQRANQRTAKTEEPKTSTKQMRFECEPNVFLQAEVVLGDDEEIAMKNARMVESRWKELWPATQTLLKKMRKDYDFSTDFKVSDLRVTLLRTDELIGPDTTWELSFNLKEENFGHWGIAFQGWTIEPKNSQPYF